MPAPLPLRLASPDALVVQSLTRIARGDFAGGLAAWREALEGAPSPRLLERARPTLLRVEGRGPRDGAPPAPTPPAEPASAAWACAWAGDLAEARRLAEAEAPPGVDALGVLGAVHVLEGRPAEGIALLDRALALGGGQELVLHRTRALVHLGRLDEARRALTALVDGESFARRVLNALVSVRAGQFWPSFRIWRRRVAASEVHLNGLFANELPAVVGRAALDCAFASPAQLGALLEGVLGRMAGNLGLAPTFAEVAPGGGRRFVRLALPPTTRAEAVDALYALRQLGAAGAEAALDAVVRRHPHSVHARCYRGELYLWLGRYQDAWREFLATHRIEPARWADVGMLAVLVLTGRLRRARLMALYAEHHFSFIPGGTLPVYRGALLRRTGDLAAAVTDLDAALAVKPTRVGARIELCLALRSAGRRPEATDHAAELVRSAAPLLVDAAEARRLDWRREPALLAGDDVLTEALRAMRGNRSSALVTWVDAAGALRVLEPREPLREEARRTLDALGEGHALRRRSPTDWA